MAFCVYIVRSTTTAMLYCGQSSDLEHRIAQHNDPTHTGTRTTKRHPGPWVLIWHEQHPTRKKAIAQETQIKRRGVRRFLASLTPTSGR